MRSVLAILWIVPMLFFLACKESVNKKSSLELFADSIIQPLIDSSKIAGASLAIVQGKDTLLRKTYGYADLEYKIPMPLDATFEIGSITKQFTAAAILQLVEQGKLSLEDDPAKYIRYDSKGKKVNIRQLMNHTSGIRAYTEMPVFGNFGMQQHKRDSLVRLVERESFDFMPGEMLIYNNTGFFMLGLIIEKVSGLTYEEYVQKNLFEKAGMNHSYYASENKIISHRAHGYDFSPKGLVRAGYINHLWPYAAGSLASNPDDLVKWNNAIHHGKILGPKAYQEFLTTAVLNDGTSTRYAKGITVTKTLGETLLEHGGGINGFLSENYYFPEKDLHIVVLFNTAGPSGPGPVTNQLAEQILGKEIKTKNTFSGDLNSLTGNYLGRGRGRDIVVHVFLDQQTPYYVLNKDTIELSWNGKDAWIDKEKFFFFNGNELKLDFVYALYRLKK